MTRQSICPPTAPPPPSLEAIFLSLSGLTRQSVSKTKLLDILVSRTGLNEWFSKTKTFEQAESIKHLDEILTNAVFNHHSKNEHPKKGDEKSSFDYYDYQLTLNDKQYKVILTIKNVQGLGSIYYHHYLDDIKIEPSSSMIQP